MRSTRNTIVSAALAAALVVVSTSKLVAPYSSTYALPEWVYYLSALGEACLAVALVGWRANWVVPACAAVLSLVGITVSLLHDGNCG